MASRPRSWTPTDLGMAQLVRLVLADDWQPGTASARLRQAVTDPGVLRQMAGRVRRAISERPSEVAQRAALTLELAIGEVQFA